MDWIKLSTLDLEDALNKPQLELLKAQCLRSAGRDPANEILSSIVARVRAEIASSPMNKLDSDHSRIPLELKDAALKLAVEALQSRVPTLELTQNQIKQADAARELLLRVANGSFYITPPIYGIRVSSKNISSAGAKHITNKRNLRLL